MNQYLHEAQHQAATRQHVFLLGAAGAAIAFAIHETADRKLEWSLAVIALAVLFWALSFVGGIFYSHAQQRAIAANIAANESVSRGLPDRKARADAIFDKANKAAGRNYQIQLWGLLIGSIFYVGGHAFHLFENERANVGPSVSIVKEAAKSDPTKSTPPPRLDTRSAPHPSPPAHKP